jgi:hypothetical protein
MAATKVEKTNKKGKGHARRGSGTPLEVDVKEGKKHKGLKKSGA